MFKDLIAGHARELVNNQDKDNVFTEMVWEGERGTLHCISCYELSVNWVEIEDISTTLETHSMENGGDVAPDKPWYQLGQVSSSHHCTLSSRFNLLHCKILIQLCAGSVEYHVI